MRREALGILIGGGAFSVLFTLGAAVAGGALPGSVAWEIAVGLVLLAGVIWACFQTKPFEGE